MMEAKPCPPRVVFRSAGVSPRLESTWNLGSGNILGWFFGLLFAPPRQSGLPAFTGIRADHVFQHFHHQRFIPFTGADGAADNIAFPSNNVGEG